MTAPHTARPAAHIIRDDAEAIDTARRLAEQFAEGAPERDRTRRLPLAEIEAFSQSGLWAMTVPKAYGGADVSYATVGKVFTLISAADPSIGQIAQSHISAVHFISRIGTPEQRDFLLPEILRGARFGNASSEIGGKRADTLQTRLTRDGDGYRLNGRKFYSTGALLAHYVTVTAFDPDGKLVTVVVQPGTPGLTISDDWDSFGQRTTASGTVTVEDIAIPENRVLRLHRSYENHPQGAVSQITHVGIDIGIASAAIRDTIDYVRRHARPWRGSGVEHGYEDPYTISAVGSLAIRLHAAEAMLERAGRVLDAALRDPREDSIAEASIAVAEAKVLASEIAVEASNKLFELAGTRATLSSFSYDRHWRNARTHTLHDPARWKYHAVGNYHLNGVKPERQGAL